ncbi:MAG: DEAD/DEAH box helicase family protein, partial [Bacteroidota bacterium]
MEYTPEEKLAIFKNLFRGREDVFAIRWEKGAKSGYMPAYAYDRYDFQQHKRKGGSLSNYPHKEFIPLSDREYLRHFSGQQFIGVYPLLPDHTSWFIAADFDKQSWMEDCRTFRKACLALGIPSYWERSRSGAGGHIWVFFAQPYPAAKSRRIMLEILHQSGLASRFDKSTSFDRLFPNQDTLSGKGLGNLMALPLQKYTWAKDNGCFLDDHGVSYADQWGYLKTVNRATVSQLDELYTQLFPKTEIEPFSPAPSANNSLIIRLGSRISLPKAHIPPKLITFLKETLNIEHNAYWAKKKAGKSTWGTERYIRMVEETEEWVHLPRGFIGSLLRFCKQHGIEYTLKDERPPFDQVKFSASIEPRAHQEEALASANRKQFGVIAAPPGTGKSIIGLMLLVHKGVSGLILVHRRPLLTQWMDRIEQFLGIPKQEIGRIGQGKAKVGKRVTVATYQSLGKYLVEQPEAHQQFGILLVDECHHVPSVSYREVLQRLNPYYQYGLTATPFRKSNDERLIFALLGELICELTPQAIADLVVPRLIVRDTAFDAPYHALTDNFETLAQLLIYDTARNSLIVEDIAQAVSSGRKVMVLTERIAHLHILQHFLQARFTTVTLSGEDTTRAKTEKWEGLNQGDFEVLITTGQMMGEGTDLPHTSALILAFPFAFEGKVVQYLGRVQRSEVVPVVYDYHDANVDYLHRLFLKGNRQYRKLAKLEALHQDMNDE